jgi:protein-tyrosine phosphatase
MAKGKGKILFVCGGNVYRSQISEYLFKRMFANFKAHSAGLSGKHAGKTVRQVWKETHLESVGRDLKRIGIDILGNRCKRVARRDVETADKVFVMELAQKKLLSKRFPASAKKIFVLGEFAHLRNPTMPDLPVEIDAIKTARKIRKALQIIKRRKLLQKNQ